MKKAGKINTNARKQMSFVVERAKKKKRKKIIRLINEREDRWK